MKKKTLIILLVAAAMLLCLPGCAEVPDDVQNEINSYESIEEGGEKHGVKFIPISEIIGKQDATPSNVKQFLMHDITVDYPDAGAQAMSFELNFKQFDAIAEAERIAAEQFPGLDIHAGKGNEDEVVFSPNTDGTTYVDRHTVLDVTSLGYTTIFHGESLEYCDFFESDEFLTNGLLTLMHWHPYEYFPASKIIALHSGERIEEGLSYMLPTGEVKVADAMAAAQSYLDDVMAEFEDNVFSYRIRKIYIRRIADGLYGYEFSAERLYRGIPIDSTPMYREKADIGSEGYFIDAGDPIYVWMIAPDKVDYFHCEARRQAVNAAPAYDNVLSLESALGMVSETLTSAAAFRVNSVELLYLNGYYGDAPIQISQIIGDTVVFDLTDFKNRPRETRLVWALLLDDPRVAPGTLEFPHDPHYSFFIDVLTGELIGFCEGVNSY